MNKLARILESGLAKRPVLMGILNITPDSFSDGGQFIDPRIAIDRAGELLAAGADIIDCGAESTRPGAERIDASEQIARLEPILPQICQIAERAGSVVSIDTTRAEVAEFAINSGASIVNDVSAGRDDDEMFSLVADKGCALVLMHMLGQPATMQDKPEYGDVLAEVREFLADRLKAACDAGIPSGMCVVDPGIGFGKRLQDNLRLMRELDGLLDLGAVLLVGPSRKRFIGEISSLEDKSERLGGTIAACLQCFQKGATIFRVHDVGPVRQALEVASAIGYTE